METPTLKRSVTLGPLIFYGLGTMVGAGFYALLGRVAGLAGMASPVALAVAGALALLSAASYAELSSRFPVSAGEVRYVAEGFRVRGLAIVVGWMVIVTGVVSAATLSVATIGFLGDLIDVPDVVGVTLLVGALGAVAAWGIGESVLLVFVITVVEVGALVCAAVLAGGSLQTMPARWPELLPPMEVDAWGGILSAAFLAFYAFIGFEDMVNIAEEVEQPRRVLPTALLVSVTITTLLYVVVSVVAVLAVSPAELAASASPVVLLVSEYGPFATTAVGVVSILAGINGALVQIVMASRVGYGMANQGQAPRWIGRVHPRTRTPVVATSIITALILVLAAFFPLATLARTTSAVILGVFALVNLSLYRIKGEGPDRLGDGIRLPRWVPLAGACTCAALLLTQGWTFVRSLG